MCKIRKTAALVLAVSIALSCGVANHQTAGPAVVDAPKSPTAAPVALPNKAFSLKFAVLGDFVPMGVGQALNFGRGGLANDVMLTEAQDYSGRNNANMSTPSDGASPRMQMYLFDGEDSPRFN